LGWDYIQQQKKPKRTTSSSSSSSKKSPNALFLDHAGSILIPSFKTKIGNHTFLKDFELRARETATPKKTLGE